MIKVICLTIAIDSRKILSRRASERAQKMWSTLFESENVNALNFVYCRYFLRLFLSPRPWHSRHTKLSDVIKQIKMSSKTKQRASFEKMKLYNFTCSGIFEQTE